MSNCTNDFPFNNTLCKTNVDITIAVKPYKISSFVWKGICSKTMQRSIPLTTYDKGSFVFL